MEDDDELTLLAANAFIAACILCGDVKPLIPNWDNEFRAFMAAADDWLADNEWLLELDRDESFVELPWPPPDIDDDEWFGIVAAASAAIDAECLFDWFNFFDDDDDDEDGDGLLAACCMANNSLCKTAGL